MANDAYSKGYFNIQDILVTQERLSCKFETDVPQMGFLDSSCQEAHLRTGTKLELPFWLASHIHRHGFISVEVPKSYRIDFHDILKADPKVVDLRKNGPYYYALGTLLVGLNLLLSADIANILLLCFRHRFLYTMNYSNQLDHTLLAKSISKLDVSEMEIFNAGQQDAWNFWRWQQRSFSKLMASSIALSNKNKRKFDGES